MFVVPPPPPGQTRPDKGCIKGCHSLAQWPIRIAIEVHSALGMAAVIIPRVGVGVGLTLRLATSGLQAQVRTALSGLMGPLLGTRCQSAWRSPSRTKAALCCYMCVRSHAAIERSRKHPVHPLRRLVQIKKGGFCISLTPRLKYTSAHSKPARVRETERHFPHPRTQTCTDSDFQDTALMAVAVVQHSHLSP